VPWSGGRRKMIGGEVHVGIPFEVEVGEFQEMLTETQIVWMVFMGVKD
jgi:hypothetical protein